MMTIITLAFLHICCRAHQHQQNDDDDDLDVEKLWVFVLNIVAESRLDSTAQVSQTLLEVSLEPEV